MRLDQPRFSAGQTIVHAIAWFGIDANLRKHADAHVCGADPHPGAAVSDLTAKEQRSVRTTLLFLRVRAGGAWEPVAKALHVEEDTVAKVAHGRRPVTARLSLRVARLIEVGVDDLLTGRPHVLSSRVCPHCGHPPEDFVDKETVVTDRASASELTVLDGGKR